MKADRQIDGIPANIDAKCDNVVECRDANPGKALSLIGARMTPHESSIPVGLCQCGCGQKTTISSRTQRRYGWIKGVPKEFVLGHKRKPMAADAIPFKINGTYCRVISLTQGQFAVVEESDYWSLMEWKWWAQWCPDTQSFYAVGSRQINGKRVRRAMGSVILGLPVGLKADHENHETLFNVRWNLRPANQQQNRCNCLSTPHSTPFKGVCRQKGSKTFRVQIGAHGVKHYLGMSKTAEDGARIYDEAAKRLHGEFAWTN